MQRMVASLTLRLQRVLRLRAPSIITRSAPNWRNRRPSQASCAVMEGPASWMLPSLLARSITTSPMGVEMPVVSRISRVTSQCRRISSEAVATSVPSRT